MAGQALYFCDLRIPYGTHWGFDSFVGLSLEAKGAGLLGKHWKPGVWTIKTQDECCHWMKQKSNGRRMVVRMQELFCIDGAVVPT